ncbi:MAG: hypothetical protein LBV29_08875, partial [Azoarcus sp.]|nr:hypothetical protein [Azoarcus sp.]
MESVGFFAPRDAESRSAVVARTADCLSSKRVVSEGRLLLDELPEKSLNAICLAPLQVASSGLGRK